jgi:hypothetical protein
MSTVYTFRDKNKINNDKTTENVNRPRPVQRSVAFSDTSTYQFKKPMEDNDKSKVSGELKLDFNDTNFPVLESKTEKKVESKVSCWGNKEILETLKTPFTDKPFIPKKDIPPLFKKVEKKKIKNNFDDEYSEDENSDDDDDCYGRRGYDHSDDGYDDGYDDNNGV